MRHDEQRELSEVIARIRAITPFEERLYRDIDLNRLAVFGIAWLRSANIAITIERLAVVLFHFFPAKYAMTEFKMYPDLVRTQRAVLQLRPKYRNWATGSVPKGNITLTQKGHDALIQVRELLARDIDEIPDEQQRRSAPRAREISQKWVAVIRASSLYAKYQNKTFDDEIVWDFQDLLRVSEDTDRKTVNENYKRLRDYVMALNEEEIIEFLDWVREEFGQFM